MPKWIIYEMLKGRGIDAAFVEEMDAEIVKEAVIEYLLKMEKENGSN